MADNALRVSGHRPITWTPAMTTIAREPFRFVTQVVQIELTGLKARTVEELLEHLRVVPPSVIHQHTHRFVSDHQFLSPELSSAGAVRWAPEGSELHLMKAVSFILPTPCQATTLEEFLYGLKKVSIHSLYHHMFEARLRLEREQNDFSAWLAHSLGETALARAIARLDPYTQTMEGLRRRVAGLVAQRLREPAP
jgi:hypothetical protein